MLRSAVAVVIGFLWIGTAAAQSDKDLQGGTQATASAQNDQASPSLTKGAVISAALSSGIDSKKAKPGDAVTAHITEPITEHGKTVIPKGAKLQGHITQASARAKGDSYSTLGIVFDKAVLKHGEEMPLNVAIQAIAPPQSEMAPTQAPEMGISPMSGGGAGGGSTASGPGRSSSSGSSGGMAPAAGSTAGTIAGNVTNTVANVDTNNAAASKGAVGGLNSRGQLTPGSRGVFGLEGVGLTAAADSTQAAVITSTGKNVHLESGTQLVLVSQASTPAASPKS